MKIKIFLSLLCALLFAFSADASQKIEVVSGNNQIGIAGYPLPEDFCVKIVSEKGAPLAGVPVVFSVIDDKHADNFSFSSPVAITDSLGLAATRLNIARGFYGDILIRASTKEAFPSPVIFKASSRNKNWLMILFLELVGGLGLFLFGMFYINDALTKIAGTKLRELLIYLTKNPLRGMGTGLLVTMFNQSSTATILLEVSLVSAGLLTFYQTMAVTMGAEIGSTITAQLVAFKLTDYAVLIAGLGFYISFFSKTKKWIQAGHVILGLGIIFLSMRVIADMLAPLREYAPFMQAMESVSNPLFGIFIGLVFTMLIHSSGATAVIVIALALAGAIDLRQAIPINLGAQIGTCFTAALASIGRGREGKRAALWHVLHQSAGVLLIYPFLSFVTFHGEPAWVYFVKWFTSTFFATFDVARQIAMAHTLSAVINALIFLPFLPAARDLLLKAFPSGEEEKPFGPKYLDDILLETPSLALEQARKEVIREAEIVLVMLRESLKVFDERDLKLRETVSLMDFRVDMLRNAIVKYLTKIGQGGLMNEEQSAQEIMLLYITADIETIGDIIDKNVLALARKKLENNLWFSDEGWQDIVAIHAKITDNLEKAITALKDNNLELAKLVAETKANINVYESSLRKKHISRLHSGLAESLETSSVHLDLIDNFKRINSYISSVGNSLTGKI
ncbi:MAG TPA: sodium:solute symporter [Elusimicrobia bacterium]|nr:sodium:solute symporter [Elusimicrobiota bacterium]